MRVRSWVIMRRECATLVGRASLAGCWCVTRRRGAYAAAASARRVPMGHREANDRAHVVVVRILEAGLVLDDRHPLFRVPLGGLRAPDVDVLRPLPDLGEDVHAVGQDLAEPPEAGEPGRLRALAVGDLPEAERCH